MNIAIDASSYAKQGRTGIGKYIRCLAECLADIDKENTYFICHRLSRLRRRRHFLKIDRPNFRNKIIQEPFNPFFRRRIDVFHGPDGRLPSYRNVKTVVTVHDVSVLVSDAYSDEKFRKKKAERYRDLAERATCIIADSESTRQSMIEHLNADGAKIRVVPLGVSGDFRPCSPQEKAAILEKFGIERDFILCIGAITKRKNVRGLIRAFDKVSKSKDVLLVLAGRPGQGCEEELAPIEELGLKDKVKITGYVAEDDLPGLYSSARLLAFPSLYEGFGIPLLETMACGTPAVTSNRASLPEVAGDAALLVDPHDADAMADAMTRLLEDEQLYQELRERGIERAKLFPWKRTARATLEAYKEAYQA